MASSSYPTSGSGHKGPGQGCSGGPVVKGQGTMHNKSVKSGPSMSSDGVISTQVGTRDMKPAGTPGPHPVTGEGPTNVAGKTP